MEPGALTAVETAALEGWAEMVQGDRITPKI